MSNGPPRILVVIPAFNEAANLPLVIGDVRQHCPTWDVAVVDDGSADNTAAVARQCGATVLRLPFNLGIGGAVQTGLIFAQRHSYDVCVQVDGDGQHDPRESARLVEELLTSGTDAVVGSRFLAGVGYQLTFTRRLGIRALAWIIGRMTGAPISDPTSGQRALGRRAIELLAPRYPQEYPEPEAIYLLRRSGLRVIELPVRMKSRCAGRSSIRHLHYVLYVCKVLLGIMVQAMRPSLKEKTA